MTILQKLLNFFRPAVHVQKNDAPVCFKGVPANDEAGAPIENEIEFVDGVISLTIVSSEVRSMRRSKFTYAKALFDGKTRVAMAFADVHKALNHQIVSGRTIKVRAVCNRNKTLTILGLAA